MAGEIEPSAKFWVFVGVFIVTMIASIVYQCKYGNTHKDLEDGDGDDDDDDDDDNFKKVKDDDDDDSDD